MEGGGLLYNALLAGTVGVIITGIAALINWLIKGGKKKEPSKTTNKTQPVVQKPQCEKLQPLDEMAKNLTQDERAQIFSQMHAAHKLADDISNPSAYCENEEDMLKMILIHKGNEKIINAEIIYFVYGIHDQLKAKLSDKFKGELFKNVDFLEKVHMPVIGIITDAPPKQLSCSDYANMVCELLFAQSDNEFLSIFDKYNYEYPDRIKKMISNNIDVLAETAFYSVATTALTAEGKYLNKGKALFDFILYYHTTILAVFMRYDISSDVTTHFEKTLRKNFLECAQNLKEFESNEQAEKFFDERYNKYKETISIFDDVSLEALEELVAFTMYTHNLAEETEEDAVLEEYKRLLPIIGEEAMPYFEKLKNAYGIN